MPYGPVISRGKMISTDVIGISWLVVRLLPRNNVQDLKYIVVIWGSVLESVICLLLNSPLLFGAAILTCLSRILSWELSTKSLGHMSNLMHSIFKHRRFQNFKR